MRDVLSAVGEVRDLLAAHAVDGGLPDAPELPACERVLAQLQAALADEPPATLATPGVIRPGYSTELDELVEKTAVEVGNIFPLGTKYADALGMHYVDENGAKQSVVMGSYGIGISRLMGLIAEHFADEKGLVWPQNVAPAKVHLLHLPGGEAQAEELYRQLTAAKMEVIYDDRDISSGLKFADADLMGVPVRIVCSKKTADSKTFEVSDRTDGNVEMLAEDDISSLQKMLEK